MLVPLDDDAVLAAAVRVHDQGKAVSALRVAVELEEAVERGWPDEDAVAAALTRLVDDGRLLHQRVHVSWTSVPDSGGWLDFYRPVPSV